MGIEIRPYTINEINAVKDFNRRLRKFGITYQFPETNIPEWLPKLDNRKIYQEYFLAVENNIKVRGAYILKHQEFVFYGEKLAIGYYHLPISEGIINKDYFFIGSQMLRNALKRQPFLFASGMSSPEELLPQLLKVMAWNIFSIPFFFKINNPQPFLKNITVLRKTFPKKLLTFIISITGVGWVTIKMLHDLIRKEKFQSDLLVYEVVADFSCWADELWEACKSKYAVIAVRDSSILNILYACNSDRFIRVKVLQQNKVIGWAVVLNTIMSNHKQFGNMRVGSIVDCLALPSNASKVVVAATDYLENAGVDLIVSNQSHNLWCSAFQNAGYIKGPSNFIFAASKKLSGLIDPFESNKTNIHLTRGDVDGPIHL